jgi:colanic acid biosynthesis glycosyl transferase WcaI
MRILMLTQWFNPEPTFKGLIFAKELKKLGHEVEILTGFPNYPSGRVYSGYKIRPFQREMMEGIPVLRVALYPSHDNSAIRRIINYLSFAVAASVIGAFKVSKPDVIYVYHPPATIGLPALFLHCLYRAPFVYDIEDLWPDTLTATGMFTNKTGYWLVDKWCAYLYKKASKIVVLSPGLKAILIKRKVPENKIEVIYNWCDEERVSLESYNADLARELGMEGRFNVVFAGNIGRAQALDAVIDAAALVAKRHPDIQFVFVGDGIECDRLKQRARDAKLSNVTFLGRHPISEISAILALADVLLVHLKDAPLFAVTIPSKTQAYMSVGRPILMAVRGDAAELVTRANAGVSCSPEDPDKMAESIHQMYTMPRSELREMGKNGKQFYLNELCMTVGVRRFEQLFKSVSASA